SPFIWQDEYWTADKPQEPGQWFQIDMGAKRSFSRMLIDTRSRFADYARGYEVYVSNDGTNWGAPIAHGACTQSALRLAFPAQSARYVKLVQTGKTWHPWVIANIEVYAPIGTRTAVPAEVAETQLEPRAWTASCGPNRWYDVDIPLRPRPDENRYTATNQPQRPGHYYQVDMGEPTRFNKIEINCGRSLSDYPRGYDVQTSADGETWGKPIASGRGESITDIVFPTQTARFVRVTLTRSARYYWSLAEFKIFQPATPTTARH
ncbi:MAG TPA: discoidin domain-containing protein, partial [Chthonomonadaceae bacterium]|nr:discoidin domain-containing protein [Chthonomonadaceae bacterium]